MPGGPVTVTGRLRRSRRTAWNSRSSAARSASRPTRGTRSSWPVDSATESARQAATGSRLPFTRSGATASMRTRPPTSPAVSAPIRISCGPACDWRRAAVCTTSPTTRAAPPSAPATTASPEAIPQWMSSRTPGPVAIAATDSRTAQAARTACSASSSWVTKAPKTAITASPMNFSTTPPCSVTAAVQAR